MFGKVMRVLPVFCLSLVVSQAFGQEAAGHAGEQLPPARKIPGITVEDPFPNACTDCHLNYTEQKLDVRFSTLMGHWIEGVRPDLLVKAQSSAPEGVTLRGKHPDVLDSVEDVPAACLDCHDRDSRKAPPFVALIHRIHLTGGQENHFLTLFQGECTYCHKLDQATGRWHIPSAPEK